MEGICEMSEFEYNLGNTVVVLLTCAGVHFLPTAPALLLVLSALVFQSVASQKYSRENDVKVEYHFLIVACVLGAVSFWMPPNIRGSVVTASGLVLTLFAFSVIYRGERDETEKAVEDAVTEIKGKMEGRMADLVGELENRLEHAVSEEEAARREALLRERLTEEQSRELGELEARYARKIAALQSEKDSKSEAEIRRIEQNKDIEINKIKAQTNELINRYVEEYKGKIERKNRELDRLRESNADLLRENSDQKKLISEHKNAISAREEMMRELNRKLSETLLEKEKAEAENRLLERNIKIINDRFPEEYKQKKASLQKKYKHIKNTEVLDFITTGEIHYEISRQIREGDYSAIVIEYAKSVETLFIDILKARHLYKPGDEKLALFDLMKEYIDKGNYASIWDSEFREKLDRVRKIRNPAAHKETVSYEDAMRIRTIVLGGGERGIDREGLISYMDNILHKAS